MFIFFENVSASHRDLTTYMSFLSEQYIKREGHNTKCDIKMIAEFTVIPVGVGTSLSKYVAECLKIVRKSGLRYQLTPMGTILEGDYDAVMGTIGQCHHRVRSLADRVLTEVRIDDRADGVNEMERKVKSVEGK